MKSWAVRLIYRHMTGQLTTVIPHLAAIAPCGIIAVTGPVGIVSGTVMGIRWSQSMYPYQTIVDHNVLIVSLGGLRFSLHMASLLLFILGLHPCKCYRQNIKRYITTS